MNCPDIHSPRAPERSVHCCCCVHTASPFQLSRFKRYIVFDQFSPVTFFVSLEEIVCCLEKKLECCLANQFWLGGKRLVFAMELCSRRVQLRQCNQLMSFSQLLYFYVVFSRRVLQLRQCDQLISFSRFRTAVFEYMDFLWKVLSSCCSRFFLLFHVEVLILFSFWLVPICGFFLSYILSSGPSRVHGWLGCRRCRIPTPTSPLRD